MRVLRILVIAAILIGAIGPTFMRPEPVEAQGPFPPSVITMDAYLHDTVTQLVYVEVWASPGGYFFPWGYTEMFAQIREPGGDWVDFAVRQRLTSLGYTQETYQFFASARDITVEVRGAVYYRNNLGLSSGYLYGTTWEVYIPAVDTDPFVNTGHLTRLSSTSIRAWAVGDPAGEGTGRLFIQYREVGTDPWSETTKENISGWVMEDWDITGLAADTPYEARAALEYPSPGFENIIYGEIRQIWDVPTGFECETQPSGAGTVGDPYIITDICELNWMRNDINAYFELGNDIDASETSLWRWNSELQKYEGFEMLPTFGGHLDGQGHRISGLYVNNFPGESRAGLFDAIATGTVINLTLYQVDITGGSYVGALAGYAGSYTADQPLIENVHVSGVVRGGLRVGGMVGEHNYYGRYFDCSAAVSVGPRPGSNLARAGGFFGHIGGDATRTPLVERCFATGDVYIYNTSSSVTPHGGGFMASAGSGTFRYLFATGDVHVDDMKTSNMNHARVGAFAGIITSSGHHDLYARGNVTLNAPNTGHVRVGGFIGRYGALVNAYSTGLVTVTAHGGMIGGFCGEESATPHTACFWDMQTSGLSTSDGGTGQTTAQMKTQSTFTDAGWDFVNIWGIDPAINDGYPYLQALEYSLTVTTQAGDNIDATSFDAHGTITEADPNAYTRGFVYMEGTTGDPTLSDDWVSQTGDYGTGAFTLNIADLTPGTYYRVRAFAASTHVFAYGNTVTVMTTVGPTAVTLDAEQMSWQSWNARRLHGYIDNDGGLDCEVRFQYGLDPLNLNLATTWRDRYPGVCPPRGFQTGDYFYADITLYDAELGQTWYFRAQAENADGLSSGAILSFTLGDEAPDEGLTVVTYAATDRTGVSFLAHGALLVADPQAFRRGFVYMAGGYGEPTLTDTVVQEGGTFGAAAYSLFIDGLTPGEEYRVRAFAENDDGVAYGNTLTVATLGAPVVATRTPTDIGETSFRARGEVLSTGDTVTRRGFVYIEGNSGIPTLTDDVVDEFGLWGAAPYNLVVPGLTGGTYYRVRAFATNAIGTGYGGTITVRTIGTPDVDTNAATNIGITTARLHGQVIDDGGSACQWRLQWGIATGVYTEASAWTGALVSGQAFHVDITELQPDTTYYFRAQARNAVGLASGAELTFDTEDGVGDPSFLTATPLSGTEIGLVWLTGGGADNTQIQMQQNSYPASHLHGETVYYGNESATTVTQLTPGTTYYFRAWGEGAGNYSGTYTQDMATTLAGAPGDDWTDPEEPDGWFQTPDHTGLENFPLYEQINNLFDSYGLPNTTGWVIFALLLAAIVGMLALVLSNGNVWVAMAAGGGVLVFTTWIGLLMWWIMLIYLVCVGLYAFIRSRV